MSLQTTLWWLDISGHHGLSFVKDDALLDALLTVGQIADIPDTQERWYDQEGEIDERA